MLMIRGSIARRAGALLSLFFVLFFANASWANVGSDESVDFSKKRAEYWLESLIEPKLSPYKGRVVYLHNDEITTVELLHGYVNGVEVERLVQLNGDKANEVAKIGHQMFHRDAKNSLTTISHDSADSLSVVPTSIQVGKITENYSVTIMKTARVAGRPCVVLKLIPKDSNRYVRQYSVEAKTGHLLKYAIYNHAEEMLEAMEFITFESEWTPTTDETGPIASDNTLTANKNALTASKKKLNASKKIMRELAKFANEFSNQTEGAAALEEMPSSGSPLLSRDASPNETNEEQRLDVKPSWLPDGFVPTQLNVQLNTPTATDHNRQRGRMFSRHYSDGLSSFTIFYQLDPSGNDSGVTDDQNTDRVLAQSTQLFEGAMLMLSRRYTEQTDRVLDDGDAGGRNRAQLSRAQLSLVGEIPLLTAERILNSIK